MKSEKIYRYAGIMLVILIICAPSIVAAANLVWQTSKQAAVALALQQDKKILLLAGRDT